MTWQKKGGSCSSSAQVHGAMECRCKIVTHSPLGDFDPWLLASVHCRSLQALPSPFRSWLLIIDLFIIDSAIKIDQHSSLRVFLRYGSKCKTSASSILIRPQRILPAKILLNFIFIFIFYLAYNRWRTGQPFSTTRPQSVSTLLPKKGLCYKMTPFNTGHNPIGLISRTSRQLLTKQVKRLVGRNLLGNIQYSTSSGRGMADPHRV